MIELLSPQSLAATLRARATEKVMSDEPLPVRDLRAVLSDSIAAAGWAPFHRPCDAVHQSQSLSGIEPWRMYALDASACRQLRAKLPTENAGKLPTMLAAANALIQVTWLPNPPTADQPLGPGQLFAPTLENMEHIAAASSAIQNLLLCLTSHGLRNYWSSGGGVLRSPEVFDWLGIPQREILLGSIFVFSEVNEAIPSTATLVGSKLRERRTPANAWMQWVQIGGTGLSQ
jgi:nitroreductase